MWTLPIATTAIALTVVASAMAQTAVVTIKGLQFTPAKLSVHVGDTVEWVNRDFVAHTATDRAGAWDITIPLGKTGSVVIRKAGTIAYYCRFHPNMTGTITAD